MTTILGGYSVFEEQFLMAVYYTSNKLNRDYASFSEVRKTFDIYENDRWLTRSLMRFVDSGWVDGPLPLGDIQDQPVELTGSGLREAERLIEANKFFLERIGEATSFIEVPASDRVVTLSHNQILAAEKPVDEILVVLQSDNGDPDHPGFRERLIGEIKAGRELIRAGKFRAFLLNETLVRALNDLIKRYKNPTLAALANALLGAIVSQLLQAN